MPNRNDTCDDRNPRTAGRSSSYTDAEWEQTCRDLLEPYRQRSCCVFLKRYHNTEAESAFWDIVYGRRAKVEHQIARRLGRELEVDPNHTVGDVLGGWRPAWLTAWREEHADG